MGIRSFAKFGTMIALSMALGTSAYAEKKRFLVKFKSAETLKAMSEKLSVAQFIGGSNNPSFGGMKLLNTSAVATESLNNVGLMVVESDDAAAASLRSHPAIAFVEAEYFHPAPQPFATRGSSLETTGGKAKSGTIPMPWGIAAVKAPEAWNVTRGENTRIVVLDTGVDVAHPALVSRLEKVRNFSSPNDPSNVTDTVGHGTHVAGTILADGQGDGLVGVAPAAKLLMGKVCSEQGCSSIAVASGINWGVSEGATAISMSLGGPFITNGEVTALNAAEAAGIVVVAASGNDGVGNVSYPAAYNTCIAVGAIDSALVKADFSQWGPELDVVAPGVEVFSSVPMGTGRETSAKLDIGKGMNDVTTASMQGSSLGTLEGVDMVYAGLGKPGDFSGINVTGKIALIARGEIAFKDKVTAAISAGAIGVLIYNNAPGLINGAITQDNTEVSIPVAMIEQTVGEAAVAALNGGQTVAGSIAVTRSDYGSNQGTSMATPHVAGVVALIRSANPNLTPAEVRSLITSTATALSPNDQNQVGSGLVNAEAAVAQARSFVPVSLSIAN